MELRVTEDGMHRFTEEGESRVLEAGGDPSAIAQTVADAVALLRQQGQKPQVRVTADAATVIAFDGTEVRVTAEIGGSLPE